MSDILQSLADEGILFPPETGPLIDRTALAHHLERAGLHLDDIPMRRFRGGFGNLNYLVSIGGKLYVLRRPPAGKLPPSANDMAREHRALSILAPAWDLVPRPLHFCDDNKIIGAPFLISEFRHGQPLHGATPFGSSPMSPELAAALSRLQIEVLTQLHGLDVDAIGASALGKRDGFVERTRAGWELRLRSAAVEPSDAAAGLFEWLAANQPEDRRVCVIHNDFKLDNILVDREQPTQAVAVLDWDMVALGDPYFDLATLLSYWAESGDPAELRAINATHSEAPGALNRAALIAAYAAASGAPLDLDRLRYFRALAQAKLGVVLLQLNNRFLKDPDAGRRFMRFGAAALPAFEMGLAIARGEIG